MMARRDLIVYAAIRVTGPEYRGPVNIAELVEAAIADRMKAIIGGGVQVHAVGCSLDEQPWALAAALENARRVQ